MASTNNNTGSTSVYTFQNCLLISELNKLWNYLNTSLDFASHRCCCWHNLNIFEKENPSIDSLFGHMILLTSSQLWKDFASFWTKVPKFE